MILKLGFVCFFVVYCEAEYKDCGRVTSQEQLVLDGGTKRGELPWHVGIYRKDTAPYKQICGGSLVSNNVVISGGVCFWDYKTKLQPASMYSVAVGKLYRFWDNVKDVDAQKSDIKEIQIPASFNGDETYFQNDIAVLILITPVAYNDHVKPVCLNFDSNLEKQQLQNGNLGKVAGWGHQITTERSELQVFTIPYISVQNCIEIIPAFFNAYITSDKFCAGTSEGTALCKGDSGAGLVFPYKESNIERYYLRGIVSASPVNEELQPSCNNTLIAFTQISKHEQLIKSVINSN